MKIKGPLKNLVGMKFGRLVVLEFFGLDSWRNAIWKCRCDCGNTINVVSGNLRTGHTKSCGCLSKPHGMYYTRFHRIWNGIKNRCTNPNAKNYSIYGGKLCERWYDFLNFKEDMYESYRKHVEEFGEKETTADRYPNQKGNYEPSNFRWATLSEQNRNRCSSPVTSNYEEHLYWRKKLADNLNRAIRKNSTESPLLQIYLGCSLLEFRKYIESQFEFGMTWNNHGVALGLWQFDHIEGCNNFDLSKEADRKECWNYKNLRPMWYEDHLKKSRLRV